MKMKKIALALVFGLVGSVTFAEAFGSLYYEIRSDGGVTITNSAPTLKGALKIPSAIDGRTVAKIAKESFLGRTALTSVTVPAGVGSIGKDAFKDCGALASFTFANLRGSVNLGDTVLQDTAVESLTLPQEVRITEKTFYDSDLRTVTFTGLEPPEGLDAALNVTNATGKLKIKIAKLVIPYAADLQAWKAALPAYLQRKGVLARSNPRVWIDAAEGGTVTVMQGTRRLTNGSTVAKGAKIICTWTAKEGYAFASASYALVASTSARRTLVVPAEDVTLAASFVTLESEKAAFASVVAEMRASGALEAESAASNLVVTVGAADFDCVAGPAGALVLAKFRASDTLLTPVSFTFTGLPTGLSAVRREGNYYLVGVPLATVGFAENPAYVRLSTASGLSALLRLNLQVSDFDTLAVGTPCPYGTTTALAAEDLPDLSRFEGHTPTNAPVGFVWEPAAATPIVFTPSAPALRKIALVRTAEALARTYLERKYVEILVPAVTSNHTNAAFAKVSAERVSPAGRRLALGVRTWFADGLTTARVTGLPTGLSFDRKKFLVSGTPSRAGTYTVTLSKTVGKKTLVQRFLWRVTGSAADFDFQVNADGLALDYAAAENRATLLAGTAGTRLGSSLVSTNTQAKVTASGLPTGLQLVRAADGSYAFAGRAMKAGTYLVTITSTAPGGAVQTRRIEYTVVAHPLKGTYRGYVATPGVGLGTTAMTVDDLGRGTLTLTEGSLKTVVKNVYALSEAWAGGDSPKEGLFSYSFKLPANKARKLPARTCRLAYETIEKSSYLVKASVGDTNYWGIVSGGKGATTQLGCWPYLTAAQLQAEDYNTQGEDVPSSYAFGYSYTNATREAGLYMTGTGAAASRTVKLAGRLPAGRSFTASTVAIALDRTEEGVLSREAPLVFAPIILRDDDGTYYKVTLPLDEDNLGKGSAGLQVWNGSAFVDGACAEYLLRPAEMPATPAAFIQALTGATTARLRSSLIDRLVDFPATGKARVSGAPAVAVSYTRTTGFVKFTFVYAKRTYSFAGLIAGGDSATGIHGLISRTADGKKFTYAKAAIVQPGE